MRVFVKKNLLLLFCAGLCLFYHAANYPYRGLIQRPVSQWKELSLNFGSRKVWAIQVPQQTIKSKIDASATRIGGWGFVLRYYLEQFPFDMVAVHTVPLRLYHREHFRYLHRQPKERLYPMVDVLSDFTQGLERHGVTAVTVPIPTHVELDRDHFFGKKLPYGQTWGDLTPLTPEDPRALYDIFYQKHRKQAVDLEHLYRQAYAQDSSAGLFIPYDFHWASQGIAIAAKGVIDKLIERGWDLESPQVVPAGGETLSFSRTLVQFLQLPMHFMQVQPEFQFREKHFTLSANSRSIRSGGGRVVLVGSSYSVGMREQDLSLGQLVSRYLRRDLVESAFHGAGLQGGLLELSKKGFVFQEGDIFVYETPVLSVLTEPKTELPVFEVARSRTGTDPG